MFISKNPDNSPEAHAHFSYIPPTLHISITFVTSLNDITIICLSLSAGKALHMHRRITMVHLHTHWHPCQLFPKLCTDLLINSISQILSLWHCLPGILVCPHTGVCNLLKTVWKTIQLQKLYTRQTQSLSKMHLNNNKRWLQECMSCWQLNDRWVNAQHKNHAEH